jgi:hypothetical protein
VPALSADPGYAVAWAKLQELTARAGELERRRQALSVGLNTPSRVADMNARAEMLLRDDAIPRSSEAETARLRHDLAAVADELAVTRQAITLQATVVDREAQRVSAATCERLRPTHREIVQRIAARLQALGQELEREHQLRAALDAAGVVSHSSWLRPMPLNGVGLPSDEHSRLNAWLREAREFKLID